MKKDEVKRKVVGDNFSLTTGSAIPSPNAIAAIHSGEVVEKRMKKEVKEEKEAEVLQSKKDEVTKI